MREPQKKASSALMRFLAKVVSHPAGWIMPFVLLAAVPLWMAWNTACRVPFLDAWSIEAEPWLRILGGEPFWTVVHEQCNDSRHDVPRLFHFIGMKLTGWDLRVDALFSAIPAVISAALLLPLARRTWPQNPGRAWVVAMLGAAIALSSRHWINWNWGVQICYTMVVLGVVGTVAVLYSGWPWWLRLVVAGLFAVAGTFSFLNGFLAWPLGFFILCMEPRRPGKPAWHMWMVRGLWIVLMLASIAGFLYGYVSRNDMGQSSGIQKLLANPLSYLDYFLSVLGASVADLWPLWNRTVRIPVMEVWSPALAVVGLIIFAALLRALFQQRTALGHTAAPWLALAGLGLCNAGLIALGRTGLEWTHAFEPRYQYFVIWFYVGTTALLFLMQGRIWKGIRCGWLVLMIGGGITGSWRGWIETEAELQRGKLVETVVVMSRVAPELGLMGWLPRWTDDSAKNLIFRIESAGLLKVDILDSSFVRDARKAPADLLAGRLSDGEAKPEMLTLHGWAMHKESRDVADGIVISAQAEGGEEKWLGVAQKRVREPKGAAKMKARAFEDRLGWDYQMPLVASAAEDGILPKMLPALPRGRVTFRAYGYDGVTGTFAPLKGEVVLEVPPAALP